MEEHDMGNVSAELAALLLGQMLLLQQMLSDLLATLLEMEEEENGF